MASCGQRCTFRLSSPPPPAHRPHYPCSLPFNFPHPGVTKDGACAERSHATRGFAVARTRVCLGSGREAYHRATAALHSWQHFDLGWAFTNAPKIKLHAPVVVTARSLGLWSMNPLRISSVEADGRPAGKPAAAAVRRRAAFAHTTVAGHQISGEERFCVEWSKQDDLVWYEVLTVSKPATPIATLALPVLRFYQRRFVDQSAAAMQIKVASSGSSSPSKT